MTWMYALQTPFIPSLRFACESGQWVYSTVWRSNSIADEQELTTGKQATVAMTIRLCIMLRMCGRGTRAAVLAISPLHSSPGGRSNVCWLSDGCLGSAAGRVRSAARRLHSHARMEGQRNEGLRCGGGRAAAV